jgi:CheY-like chemotaxis protein
MPLHGKTVFIVEDNAGNLAIARVYLESHGAAVHFCRRAGEMLTKIQSAPAIDVILMDLMLPQNISGFTIFGELQKIPHLRDIPVVAVSASDPDSAMPRALRLGFSGFIAKPISPRLPYFVADVIRGQSVWIADSTAF